MKAVAYSIVVLGLSCAITWGQTRGQTRPISPGLPASAASSGLSAFSQNAALVNSTLNANLTTLSNLFGGGDFNLTNGAGGILQAGDIAPILLQLQRSIEEALPALAALNEFGDQLALQNLVNGVGFANQGVAPGSVATTTPGGRPLAADANRFGALTPTGPGGSQPGAPGTGFNTGVPTNGDRDTLRALWILQNDLERVLPIVASLNGTATTLGAGLGTPVNTNGLGRGPSMSPGAPALTPTGRPVGR